MDEGLTLAYVAPEVLDSLRTKKIDVLSNHIKSDIFSVGLVMLSLGCLELFHEENLNLGTNTCRKKIEKKLKEI